VAGYFFPRLITFPVWLVVFILKAMAAEAPSSVRHLRGARVVRGSELADETRADDGREQMYWGALPIPRVAETTGFLLVGAPGSGKSVAIHEGMMPVISRRGDSCFISDRSGLFVSRYFDAHRGDQILNPLDARAAPWSPLAEIQHPWDTKTMAKSLVPDRTGEGGEWSRYAQNLVAAILLYCWNREETNGELYRLAVIADQDELVEVVAGTAAAPYLAPGNERMLGSIRGVAGEALASLEYLRPTVGRDGFSIREYVLKQGRGRLFFPYMPDQRLALQSLVSACADVFSTAVMMLPESRNADAQRSFLVMDELSSLAKVATLEEFLTNGRKHGGAAILGVQNIAQMYERYGRDGTQTMISSLASWLILRTGSDEGTAEHMSKSIGDRQIARKILTNAQEGIVEVTKSSTEQVVIERTILPSEIQALSPLRGFARLAGHPVAKVQLTPNDAPLGVWAAEGR
jgi:type IV secretory pathway TraG/TraD family ATPase VirD4